MRFTKKFILLFLMSMYQSGVAHKYVIGHWSGGMGICLSSVLNHLLYCEKENLTPVVYWYKSLYWNEHGFNGNTTNAWEYYFEPVSPLRYSRGDRINTYCSSTTCGHFNYYDAQQSKRDLAHTLIKKYIHPNAIVRSKIEQFYMRHMYGKKTIGIHIRGTDKYKEEKPVPISDVVAEALKYADRETQFFVATDEQRILDTVLMLLKGKKVLHYSCYRSEDGRPLHYKVKPSPGQLGEDVIVEMWLMAYCDMLIHTLSNVSSIPLYINPDLIDIPLRAI